MENPFEIIVARLETIEDLLLDLKRANGLTDARDTPNTPVKVMDMQMLCQYVPTLKRSTVYDLTAAGKIPHSKHGKRLYFDKNAIDQWLLENQRGTIADE